MDKIEVTQADRDAAIQWYNHGHLQMSLSEAFASYRLATRTDATPVAVEMVAELQLSAFLAGRGSIRTKANGNTHESSPGPTMDDYRRMARFALAEGWVDATPVAWMDFNTLEVAIGEGLIMDLDMDDDNDLARIEWVSTSIANRICKAGNTAATDVAALVEAVTRLRASDGSNGRFHAMECFDAGQEIDAALAPFTKGQNDDRSET